MLPPPHQPHAEGLVELTQRGSNTPTLTAASSGGAAAGPSSELGCTMSAFGKQTLSRKPSAGGCVFGTSKRSKITMTTTDGGLVDTGPLINRTSKTKRQPSWTFGTGKRTTKNVLFGQTVDRSPGMCLFACAVVGPSCLAYNNSNRPDCFPTYPFSAQVHVPMTRTSPTSAQPQAQC